MSLDKQEYNAIMAQEQYDKLSTKAKKAMAIIIKARKGDNHPIDNLEYCTIPLIERVKAIDFLQAQGEI